MSCRPNNRGNNMKKRNEKTSGLAVAKVPTIPALSRLRALGLPIIFLSLAVVAASAQSATDFGTVRTGATAVVNLIRIIGGVVGVGALVFATFRLYGGDMVRGLMGVFGGILGLLIAANAQSIVTGFYSTTG